MELFEIVNGFAVPSVHALMLEPFKSIREKDKSKDFIESTKYFTYIELMCSPRKSNVFHAEPEETRGQKVKIEVWKDENYPIPDLVMYGIVRYKELLEEASESYGLYIDAIVALNKTRKFLRTFDPDERTPSGNLLLKPKDITNSLKDIDDVDKALRSSKERVLTELDEAAKTRNQREIGDYER